MPGGTLSIRKRPWLSLTAENVLSPRRITRPPGMYFEVDRLNTCPEKCAGRVFAAAHVRSTSAGGPGRRRVTNFRAPLAGARVAVQERSLLQGQEKWPHSGWSGLGAPRRMAV